MKLKMGGLFSGIGGFELAARNAGLEPVWAVEIDAFCRAVLAKNFEGLKIYEDVKTTDFAAIEPVSVLTGGFPCQPFSVAGKRAGTDDDRYLWPEMLRAIREIRPTWVVGENVAGFVNMELDAACADLESEGYETRAFLLPAIGIDAPHERFRVFIVAHSDGFGLHERDSNAGRETRVGFNDNFSDAYESGVERRAKQSKEYNLPDAEGEPDSQPEQRGFPTDVAANGGGFGCGGGFAHAHDAGQQEQRFGEPAGAGLSERVDRRKTERGVCGVDDGFPAGLDRLIERSIWRKRKDFQTVAPKKRGFERKKRARWKRLTSFWVGKTPPAPLCNDVRKWNRSFVRRLRLKALGNAIVPHLAEIILTAIVEFERSKQNECGRN